MKGKEGKVSRREFLAATAGFFAGVAVGSGGLLLLPGCTQKTAEKQVNTGAEKVQIKEVIPKPPWKYEKIDPQKAAQIAYESWYEGFCTYAVVKGVFKALGEKVGEPYKSFPLEAIRWGHGGVVGWGTICGTLTGAGIVTGFIAGKEGEKMINDIVYWYSTTELPIFEPKNPKATIKNKSVSNSPLCHISVGRWMKKENVKFFSPERKERCARLAADVAAKTVEILNAWKDGTYKPAYTVSQAKKYQITAQNNCMDCHAKGVPPLPGT